MSGLVRFRDFGAGPAAGSDLRFDWEPRMLAVDFIVLIMGQRLLAFGGRSMRQELEQDQSSGEAEFVLHPHRSLSTHGFFIMMALIGWVSFLAGVVFVMMGAWPVTGFFGLDVALIYLAFKLNYRSGRLYETIKLTRENLKLTRVHPSGRREQFEFNPYWTRVHLTTDRPDGRTSLRLAGQGQEVLFAQFLNDDERRGFADALTNALIASRGSRF